MLHEMIGRDTLRIGVINSLLQPVSWNLLGRDTLSSTLSSDWGFKCL